MKISVIIPVFNVKQYIAECIESIINQTYTEFEIILIDDGSSDGSGILCDKYAFQYINQIKVIHTENYGPLHARMIGVNEATAEVLVFLDGDDCLRLDALELIASCFERESCDMVMFDTGECTRFSTLTVKHSLESGQIFDERSKKDLYRKIVLGEIPNSVCLKAVKRNKVVFPDNLIQHNLKHGEDLLLSAYLITNCKKIVYLGEGLYYYRNRPGSAVHSFNLQRKESIKTVHMELEKCIDDWGIPEIKPIHNARKVKGWVSNLLLLMAHKKQMSWTGIRKELQSMAEDPYFREAYINMEYSQLSRHYCILAHCLMKKRYLLIAILYNIKQILRKEDLND